MALFKKEDKPESHFLLPRFQISPLIDCITGTLVKGLRGEYILVGGFNAHMGLTGINNGNKTLILISLLAKMFQRLKHLGIDLQHLDTENTTEMTRFIQIFRGIMLDEGFTHDEIEELIPELASVFHLRNTADISANAWYDELDELGHARLKAKNDMFECPWRGLNGEVLNKFLPHFAGIDSFSGLEPDVVTEKFMDANTAGSSDNNTMYLKDNMAKSQMLSRWVNTNPRHGVYMISTAHLGQNTSLDARSPPEKKNAFMKQNHKLLRVPASYYYYTSTLFFVNSNTPLLNGDRVPQYPVDTDDKEKGDTKDMLLEILVLRNKFGPSGVFFNLVATQNKGINWSLSEFHNIRTRRFGFTGNDQNYVLDLLPDVKLSRTTVRTKLIENPKLRRAVEITTEIYMMQRYMYDSIPKKYRGDMSEVVEGLKSWGWDLDMILNTRGYWTPDNYDHPIPHLSGYDILRMSKGEYVPYWCTEDQIPEKLKTPVAKAA